VASPLHADVLLVVGALGRNMGEALERALLCMPEPRWVVAVGDCAADGGPFRGSYAVGGGVAEAVPVDLVVPGSPPTPAQVLEGLLALLAAQQPKGRAAADKKKGRSEGSAGPWPP
jgi:Ni,Fe-hydrogenase III small subunit